MTIRLWSDNTGNVHSTERNTVDEAPAVASPTSMIGRVSMVLDCFSDGTPAIALGEIARRTGLAKSTTSRITNELVDYGYLERQGPNLSLGIRIFELGQQAARPRSLRLLALPRMAELRRATGSTVHLAVLEETTVVYIEILHSSTSPRLPSRVGGRMPAFATGVGKALLAHSPPELTNLVIARGMWKVGPNTITDSDRLREDLDGIRCSGYATEVEESGPGISCVAAPIVGRGRSAPVAAISVSGWSERLDVDRAVPIIRGVASALSEEVRLLPQLSSTD